MEQTMEQATSGALRRQTNLANESADYLAKRDTLRLAEIELMRQRERVAELRRQLPKGAVVSDYVFEEGPARSTKVTHRATGSPE
jgi:predicted dithiol-disulfide oxidoreductase (DUF899 family)